MIVNTTCGRQQTSQQARQGFIGDTQSSNFNVFNFQQAGISQAALVGEGEVAEELTIDLTEEGADQIQAKLAGEVGGKKQEKLEEKQKDMQQQNQYDN